jgi:hypothetical protein
MSESSKHLAAIFGERFIEALRQVVREETRAALQDVMKDLRTEDVVLDVKAAADYLKYSTHWVHRHWRKMGGTKVGREIRFVRSELDKVARGENNCTSGAKNNLSVRASGGTRNTF